MKVKLKANMNGKICLVTGGTNGIGKSTAHELARMGATVVIVGRDAQKTSEVVQEIRTASGNPKVDSLLADLSSQQEVRRLAHEFKNKYSQLLAFGPGRIFAFIDEQEQSIDDDGRKPLQRLVHEQQRGVAHQRAADRQHLLLAAGNLVAHVGAAFGKPRKELIDALHGPGTGAFGHG